MSTEQTPLLEIRDLRQHFPIQRGFLRRTVGYIKAVDGLTFDLKRNETLGLVGESGCGKTTVGRSLLRVYEPTAGSVHFTRNGGERIAVHSLNKAELRRHVRPHMQMIFQDPFASLNERMTVLGNVAEPLVVHKAASGSELQDRVAETLRKVGLQPEMMRRYPHSFSGGQRQRINVARALVLRPEFIVADEPVSALDVSVQAQILNLLKDLQDEFHLTYLFISHDLSVVRYISDRIAVMYAGRFVETAPRDTLLANPRHPYTEALLSAVPRVTPGKRPARIRISGSPPDAGHLPTGCSFHPRCRHATDRCKREAPRWRKIGDKHFVSCHLAEES